MIIFFNKHMENYPLLSNVNKDNISEFFKKAEMR